MGQDKFEKTAEADTRPSKIALEQAVLRILADKGATSLSTRALAKASGLPVSSIYYHFGDLANLIASTHEYALEQARAWIQARRNEIADIDPPPPEALPPLLAALIDDWRQGQRQLAFAWRECQAQSLRDPAMTQIARGWRDMWLGFWRDVCHAFRLDEHAETLAFWFDSESLFHLMNWRPAIDRACLHESCESVVALLQGRLSPERPWRRLARLEAMRAEPGVSAREGRPAELATAAANIVRQSGLNKLTHRAVAQASGVGLGVVSNQFKTISELSNAALEIIYKDLSVTTTAHNTKKRSYAEELTKWSDDILKNCEFLTDDLFLEVARNPKFGYLALPLRYNRGRSVTTRLQTSIFPSLDVSPEDGSTFSSISTGILRSCRLIDAPDRSAYVRASLSRALELVSDHREPA